MFFTHVAALGKNPELAQRARDLFEKAGWRMIVGPADLPRHSQGVWLHGGTTTERTIATWGLERLGITPQVDYTDDRPPSLQVIVGEYKAKLPANNAEHAAQLTQAQKLKEETLAASVNSLRAALEETQREREQVRGTLGGQLSSALEAVRTCKREFALARLRWIAERVAITTTTPPKVKIRFAQYSDFALAESIQQIFEQQTKWPTTLDGSNNPVLRPSGEFKVMFSLGNFFEIESPIVLAFSEGDLLGVGLPIGQRREDHEDPSLIVIEVLPFVTS